MIKMFRRRSGTAIFLAAAFGLAFFPAARSAEPTVEVPTSSSSDATSDESGVFAVPKVPLSVSVFAHGGYDDNYRTTQSAQGSVFTNAGVTIGYDSPQRVDHFNIRTGADITYYPSGNNGQQDNVNAYLSGGLTRHPSERMKLDLNVYAAYRIEPDFASNVGSNTKQGYFFHTVEDIALHYDWSQRFSTTTTEKFQLVKYEDSSSTQGSQDRIENTIGQSLNYDLFHKGNTLVAEYRFEIVDYFTSPRDSLTHYTLLGLNQEFTPDFGLTVRGGASFRSFTETNTDQIDPYFEGSLTYRGAHHSSLALRTSYGFEAPNTANVLSTTTFRVGLDFNYGLTAKIMAHANAYYHHDENQGVTSSTTTGMLATQPSQDGFDTSLGLRYLMTRHLSFDLGFQYTKYNSDQSFQDYSRFRYFGGLAFTF